MVVKLPFNVSYLGVEIRNISISVIDFTFDGVYLIWEVVDVNGSIVNMVNLVS